MRKKRFIYYSIAFLLVIITIMIVYTNMNQKQNNIDANSETERIEKTVSDNEIMLVSMDKNDFEDISAHEYISLVETSLAAHQTEGLSTTFMFSDGTGIYYPGSDINETAFYGKTNDNGIIVEEQGYIKIASNEVIYSEASTTKSENSAKVYKLIPDEFVNDSTYYNVDLDNIINVSLVVPDDADINEIENDAQTVYDSIKNVDFEYREIHIMFNYTYCYVGNSATDNLTSIDYSDSFIK